MDMRQWAPGVDAGKANQLILLNLQHEGWHTFERAQKNHIARIWLALSACSAWIQSQEIAIHSSDELAHLRFALNEVSPVGNASSIITHSCRCE